MSKNLNLSKTTTSSQNKNIKTPEVNQSTTNEVNNLNSKNNKQVDLNILHNIMLLKKSDLPYEIKYILAKILRKPQKNKIYQPKLVKKYIMAGTLMTFYYPNPITKKSLTVYDALPMVVLLKMDKKGFLGINMHYIHPAYRQQFVKFLKFKKNLEYKKILKAVEKFILPKAFSYGAIRRYSFRRVYSNIIRFETKDYGRVLEKLPPVWRKRKNEDFIWREVKQKAMDRHKKIKMEKKKK